MDENDFDLEGYSADELTELVDGLGIIIKRRGAEQLQATPGKPPPPNTYNWPHVLHRKPVLYRPTGKPVTDAIPTVINCWTVAVAAMKRQRAMLPNQVARAVNAKFIERAMHATQMFPLVSDIIPPGGVSPIITGTFGSVTKMLLVDIEVDHECARWGLARVFNIGQSVLVQPTAQSPASPYYGASLACYDTRTTGDEEVMPEFGMGFAGIGGAPIQASIQFVNKGIGGADAVNRVFAMNLCCLTDTCATQDAYMQEVHAATWLGYPLQPSVRLIPGASPTIVR